MSSNATLAIRLTLQGADLAGRGIAGLAGAVRGIPGALASANQGLYFFLGNLKSIEGFVAKLGRAAFENLILPNIKADNQVEALTFLTGSAESAKVKMRELFDAAGRAQLPTEDVIKMYLALDKLGGSALSSDEMIQLVGKSAKLMGVSGAEAAQQIAEAWTVLQSKKPFDKQALGLARSGLISPEAVQQLSEMAAKLGAVEDAQKKVNEAEQDAEQAGSYGKRAARKADIKEKAKALWEAQRDLENARQAAAGISTGGMWSTATREIAAHTAKVKQADETWTDMAARIRDVVTEVKKATGTALFQALKKDLGGLRDTLQQAFNDGRLQRWAGAASKAIADLYAQVKGKTLFSLTAEQLLSAAEKGKLGAVLQTALADSAENFGAFILNSVEEHGPKILRAIVGNNTRLSSLLGLDQAAAKKSMAAGNLSEKNWNDLGAYGHYEFGDWLARQQGAGLLQDIPGVASINRAIMSAVFSLSPIDVQNKWVQKWAQENQPTPTTRRPYVSVQDDLAQKGLVPDAQTSAREQLLRMFGGAGYNIPSGSMQSSGSYAAALRQAAGSNPELSPGSARRDEKIAALMAEVDRLTKHLGDAADNARSVAESLREGATF